MGIFSVLLCKMPNYFGIFFVEMWFKMKLQMRKYSHNSQSETGRKGVQGMKKMFVLAVVALAILMPTMAGFAERDDFPRICVVKAV